MRLHKLLYFVVAEYAEMMCFFIRCFREECFTFTQSHSCRKNRKNHHEFIRCDVVAEKYNETTTIRSHSMATSFVSYFFHLLLFWTECAHSTKTVLNNVQRKQATIWFYVYHMYHRIVLSWYRRGINHSSCNSLRTRRRLGRNDQKNLRNRCTLKIDLWTTSLAPATKKIISCWIRRHTDRHKLTELCAMWYYVFSVSSENQVN